MVKSCPLRLRKTGTLPGGREGVRHLATWLGLGLGLGIEIGLGLGVRHLATVSVTRVASVLGDPAPAPKRQTNRCAP